VEVFSHCAQLLYFLINYSEFLSDKVQRLLEISHSIIEHIIFCGLIHVDKFVIFLEVLRSVVMHPVLDALQNLLLFLHFLL